MSNITKKRQKEIDSQLKANKQVLDSHKIWHKFYRFVEKTYGKDLHGKTTYMNVVGAKGKKSRIAFKSFNELELSRRLIGHKVQCKIEKFVRRSCPEIKIIRCDDSVYASSDILLIPHPKHGITIMFIPQCTSVQNQIFLYEDHCEMLIKELTKMKKCYPKN